MITVAEASERIIAGFSALPGESVATGDAAGRFLLADVAAVLTSPPWDNSSMDGYAVSSLGLTEGAKLPVVESVAAGAFPSRSIGPGEAVRVMTGAPVPEGADSVIRHEDTDDGRDSVTIRGMRDAGRNIRKTGEDFFAGDLLFCAGEMIGIAHLGAIASAGVSSVTVHRQPRVAIVSSGDELVELGDFDASMAGERIVSANSVTLAAAVREAGGIPFNAGIARDDVASVRARLESVGDVDLIVTSAGISVGDHDHVREAVTALGGSIAFWKVRMRPGAPLAFGSINGIPWIGLSGNPVSAIVTFELFARPAIRRMLGAPRVFRETISVRLGEDVTLAASLMHFLRVVMTPSDDGVPVVRASGSQSSGVLTALARADALLILPGDSLHVSAGEIHRALPVGGFYGSASSLRLT
ncbi:MAG: molybdopterin molybdotransferase MoeA [Gemmatimonadaceae bacterium]